MRAFAAALAVLPLLGCGAASPSRRAAAAAPPPCPRGYYASGYAPNICCRGVFDAWGYLAEPDGTLRFRQLPYLFANPCQF